MARLRYEEARQADPGNEQIAARLEQVRGSAVVASEPEDRDGWLQLAVASAQAKRYRQAREQLERGLEVLPGDPLITVVLARLLATSPDAAARDGRRALALARVLYQQRRSPIMPRPSRWHSRRVVPSMRPLEFRAS